MELKKHLEQTRYWELRIIAKERQIDIGSEKDPPKKQLIQHLLPALLSPKNVQRTLNSLLAKERSALDALISAEGELPFPPFRQRFGDIRPYKPWRKNKDAHPWRRENEPAQQLAYLGLIFLHPQRPKAGTTVKVIIPNDLLPLLPPVQAQASATPELMQIEDEFTLLHNITALLSFLHQNNVPAIHNGRWLSLTNMRLLNEQLLNPEVLTSIRSELQTTQIRFLHFLADSAGLIDVINDTFVLTPLAWQWLKEPPEKQLSQLWTAFLSATPQQGERWKRYRFPLPPQVQLIISKPDFVISPHLPTTPPEEALHLLQQLLKHLPTAAQQIDLSAFLTDLWNTEAALWKYAVPFEQAHQRGWAAVESPTNELAIIVIDEQTEDSQAWHTFSAQPWQKTGDLPPALADFLSQIMHGILTWWGIVQIRPLPNSRTPSLTVTPLGQWLLSNKSTLLANLEQEKEGVAPEEMPAFRHTKSKTTHPQYSDVHLHRLTILETQSATLMSELIRTRRINQTIVRTLSPRAVVVDEAQLKKLTRHLERQGIPPSNLSALPSDKSSPSTQNAHLLTVVLISRALSQWIDLPFPMPQALLDNLNASLSPSSRTAAQQAANKSIAQLARVIDGWAPSPNFEINSLPQEQTLPLIQQAINQERTLHLTYHSAARGQRTQREIEPYRLEWHRKIPYLIAYCYNAKEERRFRLDRIEQLQLDSYSPPSPVSSEQ